MSGKNQDGQPKERILDQAEALFAKKGYHAVSVREITRAAGCNLAAVNYHFGTKENLYLEVFRSRFAARALRLREHFDTSLAAQGSNSATAVVKALAEAFLEGPLTDEERLRHHQLIVRELAQPTGAFKLLAGQVMRPFFKRLADRLRPFLSEDMEDERLMLKIISIFHMVVFFNFARVMVTAATGREYDAGFKALLVEHITDFSICGLTEKEKEGQQ
ncbi:MAG: CerR family C-terminal domain-containing protein [Deltaproteobacteria bacterium]|nr:CerR family C-terminal domain-containing protein [Deltaproteobacteria bacterium]